MAVSTVTPVSVFAESEETFKIGVIGSMTGDYISMVMAYITQRRLQQMRSMQNGGFNDIR